MNDSEIFSEKAQCNSNSNPPVETSNDPKYCVFCKHERLIVGEIVLHYLKPVISFGETTSPLFLALPTDIPEAHKTNTTICSECIESNIKLDPVLNVENITKLQPEKVQVKGLMTVPPLDVKKLEKSPLVPPHLSKLVAYADSPIAQKSNKDLPLKKFPNPQVQSLNNRLALNAVTNLNSNLSPRRPYKHVEPERINAAIRNSPVLPSLLKRKRLDIDGENTLRKTNLFGILRRGEEKTEESKG
jgi:hypothetical protein